MIINVLRDSTVNYADRQVDIELLQSLTSVSTKSVRTYPAVSNKPAKIVTGIEKAAQRLLQLVLTNKDSKRFSDIGSTMLPALTVGWINNSSDMKAYFSQACHKALNQIRQDDQNTDLFGSIPADEKISRVTLIDVNLDRYNATASIKIKLDTESGDSYTYITPVATGIN